MEPFLSVMCQQSSRNRSITDQKMPIDVNGWRAGIANCKYSYLCHVKRRIDGTILNYSLAILRLLFYMYYFITLFRHWPSLGMCFSHIRCIELLMSYFSNGYGTILSNCLLINFASLTLHAQASVCFILIVIKDCFTSVKSQLCYLFTLVFKTVLIRQKSLISFFRFFFFNYIMLLWFFQLFSLIFIEIEHMLSGDIHPNPGQFDNSLKFCHWNLNGVCARDKIKIPLLEAHNSIFHYDLMVLSETYLNETVKNEDIMIDGFSTEIFRSDHPSGDKQGGVCVCFKENLPVKHRKDLEILQETVTCEISLGVALYRSPNQSNEDFEEFYH